MNTTALIPTIAAYIVAAADPVCVDAQLALPLLTQIVKKIRQEHRGRGIVLFVVPDTRALGPSLGRSYQSNRIKATVVQDAAAPETANAQMWQALSMEFEVIMTSVEIAVGLLRHPLVHARVDATGRVAKPLPRPQAQDFERLHAVEGIIGQTFAYWRMPWTWPRSSTNAWGLSGTVRWI
ncbi:hypothetical protein BC939DRAFT_496635 [Gamsiella multidivaricata]|uniref:uncharacterized protein n=1 Tax=Gamsiella multidivaricata TaxID=101098 RepID=UPI00222020FA|nr:uncharacterized protein BC939DRAFT_496635 [Gamsiella multidivaricata]KAI7817424.1 hypothetical protein BC939DRAFT_496635 [Gamsiella multidivaricata]